MDRESAIKMFQDLLEIDEDMAASLVNAGYTSLWDLDSADIVDLAVIRSIGPIGATWIKGRLKRLKEMGTPGDAQHRWMESLGKRQVPEKVHAYVGEGAQRSEKITGDAYVSPDEVMIKVDQPDVEGVRSKMLPISVPGGPLRSLVKFFTPIRTRTIGVIAIILIAVILPAIVYLTLTYYYIERAPDFRVVDIDGNTIRLSDYRNEKVVILDFMFADCSGCKKELQELKKVKAEFGDTIQILSLSTRSGSEEKKKLQDLREKYECDWPFAMTGDTEIPIDYGISVVPTLIVIDKDGYMTFRGVAVDADKIIDEVNKAISGQATRQAVVSAGVYGTAFLAGVLTFFSPCAFPLLPAYMSYYVTMGSEEGDLKSAARKGIRHGMIPATAIIIFFGMIGLIVGIFGAVVYSYLTYLEPLIGIIIILLGVLMLMGWDFPYYHVTAPVKSAGLRFYRSVKAVTRGAISKKSIEKLVSQISGRDVKLDTRSRSAFGLFSYGIAYGAASSACVAPLFFYVIWIAVSRGGIFDGFLTLFLYGMGMALLMIGATALISASKTLFHERISKYMLIIKRISAVLLIVAGLYLIWFFIVAM